MRVRLLPCLLLLTLLLVGHAPLPSFHAAPPPDPDHNPAFLSVSDDGSPLPDEAIMVELANKNPIGFLENCLRRQGREVKGYTALLRKHERIKGKLLEPELVSIAFREQPHAVRMKWLEGATLADTVLYVKGENDNQLLVRPVLRRSLSFLGSLVIVPRDPLGDEVRQSGRYFLTEFGIRYGMERTLAAWVAARKRNALHVAYLGVRPVPELEGRRCHVFHRSGYEKPEDDGITDFVTYFDAENWLQTGSVLRGNQDALIAEYYFRELKLNPTFPPDQFTSAGMKN